MDRRLLLVGVLVGLVGAIAFVGLQEGITFPLTEVDGTLPRAEFGFIPLWEVNDFFSEGHYGLYVDGGRAYYVDVNDDGVFLVPTDDFPPDVVDALRYGGPNTGYVQFGAFSDGTVVMAFTGPAGRAYPVVLTKDRVIASFNDSKYSGGAINFVDGNAENVWVVKVKGRNDGAEHYAKIFVGHYVYTNGYYDLRGGANVYDESRGDSGITDLYTVGYGVHGIYPVRDAVTGKEYLLVDTEGSDEYSTEARVLVLVDPDTFGVVDHWESTGNGIALGGARILPSENNTYYIVGKGSVLEVNISNGRIASVNVVANYWPWNAPAGDSHLLPLYLYGDTSLWVYPFQQSSEIVRFEEFEYNSISGRWKYVGSYTWHSTRNSTMGSSLYVRTPDRLYVMLFSAGSTDYSYYAYADSNYPIKFEGPLFTLSVPSQSGEGGGEHQGGSGGTGGTGGGGHVSTAPSSEQTGERETVQPASPTSTGTPSWVFVAVAVAFVVFAWAVAMGRRVR